MLYVRCCSCGQPPARFADALVNLDHPEPMPREPSYHGGGVSRMGALLFQPVWDVVARRTMIAFRYHLHIVPAQVGDDAGLLGCAVLASMEGL